MDEEIELIFQSFVDMINKIMPHLGSRTGKISMPYFSEGSLRKVMLCAQQRLKSESTMLELNVPVVVVGDLRGGLFNLFNIFKHQSLPPLSRYFFLGNFLGEGGFSLEILTLLMSMKTLFPKHIFLIRGENEFPNSVQMNTLVNEISAQYSDDLVTIILQTLSFLPLAGILFDSIFCVHGGVPIGIQTIDRLNEVQRDTLNINNPLIRELNGKNMVMLENSETLYQFLDINDLSIIIRGHERCATGVIISDDERIITLYSGSPDCNTLLEIGSLDELTSVYLEPIPLIKKKDTIYIQWANSKLKVHDTTSLVLPQLNTSLSNRPKLLIMNSQPVVSKSHPIHSKLNSYKILQNITRVNTVDKDLQKENAHFHPKINPSMRSRYFRFGSNSKKDH